MNKLSQLALAASALALACAAASPTFAADKKPVDAPIHWVKSVPLVLAMQAAEQSLAHCRANNRHPSVGVMDMDGQMKVLLIDDNAAEVGQHALVHKMYTTLVLPQQTTEELVEKSPDGVRSEIDPYSNVLDATAPGGLISPGGYALKIGNEFVGVLGVGGTGLGMKPGSEGECAKFGGDWFEGRVNK